MPTKDKPALEMQPWLERKKSKRLPVPAKLIARTPPLVQEDVSALVGRLDNFV